MSDARAAILGRVERAVRTGRIPNATTRHDTGASAEKDVDSLFKIEQPEWKPQIARCQDLRA